MGLKCTSSPYGVLNCIRLYLREPQADNGGDTQVPMFASHMSYQDCDREQLGPRGTHRARSAASDMWSAQLDVSSPYRAVPKQNGSARQQMIGIEHEVNLLDVLKPSLEGPIYANADIVPDYLK